MILPAAVYATFVLFDVVAITMGLQSRRVGRWTSSVFGERACLMPSLVPKSALAGQVSVRMLAG